MRISSLVLIAVLFLSLNVYSAEPVKKAQPPQKNSQVQKTATPVVPSADNKTEGSLSQPQEITETPKNTDDSQREKISELKEKILDQKTQMMLFKHLIRKEGVNASYPKVTIELINEMSSRYEIFSIFYDFDGERVYAYYSENMLGKAPSNKGIEPFQTSVAPGAHTLSVQIVFRGNEKGVFSYLNDYKITTQGQVSFDVQRTVSSKIEVVAFEKGWILTDFKDRPDLKIKVSGAVDTTVKK